MSDLSGAELHRALLKALGWTFWRVAGGNWVFLGPGKPGAQLHGFRFLTTGTGLLLILAEMQRRGWGWQLSRGGDSILLMSAMFCQSEREHWGEGTDLPTAVYRAALQALRRLTL